VAEFQKDPQCNLPVKVNIVRAVQWMKKPKFSKNPDNLQFDWGKFIIHYK
jgi:hypothetical protein